MDRSLLQRGAPVLLERGLYGFQSSVRRYVVDFDHFAQFKVERAVQAYPSEMSADRSLYADMGVARV
jgi:hypothetical protein